MQPSTHPDPFAQAAGHAVQRSAQLASIVMTAGQVFAWYRARRAQQQAADDQQAARAARGQQRAAEQQGRTGWAPANDPDWLGQAGLLQTARAWGAAAPFAEFDPAAAAALRNGEDRLRQLHPYAMAYYDRLRADGHGSIDAMRDTVPLFTREPDVRTGQPADPRAALLSSPAPGSAAPGAGADTSLRQPVGPVPDDPMERRGRQIVEQLQAQARASGRPELAPDELAIVLETTTNLPGQVIAQLTVVTSGMAEASRTAAQVAAESFPFTAAEAVAAARTGGPPTTSRSSARSPALHEKKRPGRSM
jgi:hypothetical protein